MDQGSNQQYKGTGALDAFLNLFSLITLGWMSIAIGMILFQIIDKFLSPGTVSYLSQFSQTSLKIGVASTIIIVPIFLLTISSLHKSYKTGKLNPQSGVYRWLTYLILLITGLNIIGRLIQLVFKFLDGDYTLPSILKILVVILIAGGIFGYYWYDLKRSNYGKRSNVSQAFFGLVIVVAIASVVTSFFIADSPQTANLKKLDQQRVNDLSSLDNMIRNYYIENEELPEDLSAARFVQFTDPQTGSLYEYSILGDNSYELCTTFNLPADTQEDQFRYGGNGDWFYHEQGRQCFTREINEDIRNGLKPVPVPVY